MLDEGTNWSPEPGCTMKGKSWINFNETKKKKKIIKIKKIRIRKNRNVC